MVPGGSGGQGQDRNARLRKHGNRVIFPEADEMPHPDKTRASSNRRRRTIIGRFAASITVRPRRQPATSTTRHTSGVRHFHRQTVFWLAAHFGHFPATATTCHADIQTHLGSLPFSPADGFRAHCPQPVHHRRGTIRCRHCCHCCLFRQIRGPFPDKTHLSRHDKQAY